MENYFTIDAFPKAVPTPATGASAVPIAAAEAIGSFVEREVDSDVVAAFKSAMEKPIADNIRLGEAMRSIVSEISFAAAKPEVVEKPVAADKFVVADKPVDADKSVVADKPVVAEKSVVAEPLTVVEKPVVISVGMRETEKTVVDGTLAIVYNLVRSDKLEEANPAVTVEQSTIVAQPGVVEKPVAVTDQSVSVEKPAAAVDQSVSVEKPVAAVDQSVSVEKPVAAVDQSVSVEKLIVVAEQSVAVEKPVVEVRPAVEKKSEDVVVTTTVTPVVEDEDEHVVLQSLDSVLAQPEQVAAVVTTEKTIAVDGVAPVEAKTAVKSAQTVMLEAASAVADVLLVSPSLVRGTGEIIVRLKPEVLDGATVKIEVQGRELKVVFDSPEPVTAAVIERAAPQLETMLSEKIHNFDFQVVVAQSVKAAEGVASATSPNAVNLGGGSRRSRMNERV